jgi:hypothetical protein
VFRERVAGHQPGVQALTLSPREKLRAHRPTVLGAVKDSIHGLEKKVSTADRQRLQAHAARIADLEARLSRPPPGACEGVDLRLPEGLPEAAPAGWRPSWPDEDLYARAQIDVAVAAMSCGAARVVTLQHTNYDGATFDFLGQGAFQGWHAMVHGDMGGHPSQNPSLTAGFRWYASSFAHLLERMQSVVEPDGRTLLDHSLVLWISEFGDGAVHSTSELPVVLAGGVGGRLRTGRHVAAAGASTGDLFASLFELFGVSSEGFGYRGDSDLFRGGIAGLV